jgi:PilZ domain-containing protein
MEHRWGQRVRINRMVSIVDDGTHTIVARLRDVSSSGAFIECQALPRASVVTIRVRTSRRTLLLNADVVRRASDGIGIEWRDFAPRNLIELLLSTDQSQCWDVTVSKSDLSSATDLKQSHGN